MMRVPIGVSPAYFIARYGDRFSADQMTAGLVDIAAMGYDGSWDIEIICPPERCHDEYEQARHFITSLTQPATAEISAP